MAGKLCWALGLVLLFAAAVLTQAPLAVGLLGFFLLLTLLLVLEVRYLRGKVEAELIVPDQPAVQGRPFVLTVRLTNHSPLPIPQLLTLVQATDEWGGNTITLRCSGMLGSKARAEQRLTLPGQQKRRVAITAAKRDAVGPSGADSKPNAACRRPHKACACCPKVPAWAATPSPTLTPTACRRATAVCWAATTMCESTAKGTR